MLNEVCCDQSELAATSYNGSHWLMQTRYTRFLPWALAITHLDQRRRYQLRFTATASSDGCARFVCPVADAGPELAGYHWRNKTGAGLLQNGMSRFIQRARFSLVFTTTITRQEWCQCSLNNPECMPIPARAF